MSLKKVNKEMLNELYELIVSVKSAEDCRDLFGDLCTNKETEQMAQRLRAAKLLLDGKTYNQVIDETDISSTRANEKIPRMVAAFKRFCNAEIGRDIFQRTYFDRVIRDEHDYEMIWNYIDTNPAKWENDCFY